MRSADLIARDHNERPRRSQKKSGFADRRHITLAEPRTSRNSTAHPDRAVCWGFLLSCEAPHVDRKSAPLLRSALLLHQAR